MFEKGFQLILSLIDGDLPAASRMTSLNAARSLGMDFQTGSIEVGSRAYLSCTLDENFNVDMHYGFGDVKVYKGISSVLAPEISIKKQKRFRLVCQVPLFVSLMRCSSVVKMRS